MHDPDAPTVSVAQHHHRETRGLNNVVNARIPERLVMREEFSDPSTVKKENVLLNSRIKKRSEFFADGSNKIEEFGKNHSTTEYDANGYGTRSKDTKEGDISIEALKRRKPKASHEDKLTQKLEDSQTLHDQGVLPRKGKRDTRDKWVEKAQRDEMEEYCRR